MAHILFTLCWGEILDALVQLFTETGYLLLHLVPVLVIGSIAVFLEHRFPRRPAHIDGLSWMVGAALTSLGWLLTIVAAPVFGIVAARFAELSGAGVLNFLDLPFWLAVLIGFMIFDLSGYVAHRLFHEVPWLWRLHRVHHSDPEVDASTALRVHPLEPFMVAFLVIAVTVVFGLPPEAIMINFLFMQVFNFWHHANLKAFPGQRRFGWIFNLPEFHEVHHSVAREHHNTNYGSVLSIWDRMFGTLTDEPELFGKVEFGLDKNYWDHPSTLTSLLVDPVRK